MSSHVMISQNLKICVCSSEEEEESIDQQRRGEYVPVLNLIRTPSKRMDSQKRQVDSIIDLCDETVNLRHAIYSQRKQVDTAIRYLTRYLDDLIIFNAYLHHLHEK